jgi:hypothetical protein
MRRLLSAHVSLQPRPLRAVVRHEEGSSHQNLPKMVHKWVCTRGWALRQVRNLTKLVEQRLRVFEVGRVEAFGEPREDRREEVAGFGVMTLVATQPGEARGGAQFPELGLLLLGDAQCFAIQILGGRGIPLALQ